MNTPAPVPFHDKPVDIKFQLSALWISTLFIYAYVDIFALMRKDYLESLLDGSVIGTPFEVNQGFLLFTVGYIIPASLMVFLSLILSARANRRANIIVASIYIVTIALSCIGESWIYYLVGSAVEIVLLATIVRVALRWPAVAHESARRE